MQFLGIILCAIFVLMTLLGPTTASATGAPPAPHEAPAQSASATANVATNIYAGPSTVFWITGTINRFETFPVLGVSADGDWYYVTATLGEGWIPANTVSVTNAQSIPVRNPGTAVTITSSVLNVRGGPGTGAQILGKLTAGRQVYLIGRSTDGSWLNIRWQYGTGWVAARYTSAGDATPTTDISTAPVTEEEAFAYVNAGSLNIRTGPGVNYDIVGVVTGGERLPILGRNSNGSWYNVQTVFGEGWASATYLITRNEFGNAPVTTAAVDPTTLSGPTAIINTGALNIRTGPGVEYKYVGRTVGGAQFEILARNAAYTWLYIQTPLGTGWVSRRYVIIRGDATNLAIADENTPFLFPDAETGELEAVAPQEIGPIAFVATGALNIRSGPNINFESIGVVYSATRMSIIGQSPDRGWWKVKSTFGDGWVNKKHILVEGDASNVPVVQ
jgi:uncharacterized protein YraI